MSNLRRYNGDKIAADLLSENAVLYDKVESALECPRDEVVIALREVIRFLSLVAGYEGGMLTPSNRVDLAWHEFILCTRAYTQFCNIHFGCYIHHSPGGKRSQYRRQYADTVRLYTQRYGTPPPLYWPRSDDTSDCGSCESF